MEPFRLGTGMAKGSLVERKVFRNRVFLMFVSKIPLVIGFIISIIIIF
ncbi:MAG: hypothetical protein ACMUHU_04515 [Thermoplasmatota archaeon]